MGVSKVYALKARISSFDMICVLGRYSPLSYMSPAEA